MKAATISTLTLALKTFVDEKEKRMKESEAAKNKVGAHNHDKAQKFVAPTPKEEEEYDLCVREYETAANEYQLALAAWMDFVNHDWH